MLRLIQISDCHLQADPTARSRAGFPLRQLEAVVRAVQAERPDLVLVTGDVSQDATTASYALAQQALSALGCPWFWLAGNHDDPAQMRDLRELHEAIDLGGWRLLTLDTVVSGQAHGEAGEERLAALAERLAEDERPTLLAMHHPPLALGSAWLDQIGLQDQERLWQVLAEFPQLKILLFGHAHQAFAARRATEQGEVSVYGCPSTTDQFLAGSTDFAVDEASRPGYRILDFHGARWTTWVERVVL